MGPSRIRTNKNKIHAVCLDMDYGFSFAARVLNVAVDLDHTTGMHTNEDTQHLHSTDSDSI